MALTQKEVIIKKDSKGRYILVSGKKIRFKEGWDIIETPVDISSKKYIGDYRAFDGTNVGSKITLAIYDK